MIINKVPNVEMIAREMTSMSQVKMIINRFFLLTLANKFKLTWSNFFNVFKLVKKDYATGIGLLIELEILTKKYIPKVLFLHNQITDMAVALGNKKVFIAYFRLMKEYKISPGISSNNPNKLVNFLSTMKLPGNLIVCIPSRKINKSIKIVINSSGIKFLYND